MIKNLIGWMGLGKMTEDQDNVIKFNKPKEVKPVQPALVPKRHEHYRVGYDTGNNMVTITLIGDHGMTMTLSLADRETEHFIRMVGAARRHDPQEQDPT